MPRVKQAGFVLERDQHPDQKAESLLSPQSSRVSPINLGVFGVDKRATAADEASKREQQLQMRQAAAMHQQMTLWQQDGWAKAVAHMACVLHRRTQGGKQGRARVAWCHDLAYH